MLNKLSFKPRLILSYIIVIVLSFGVIAYFLDNQLEENSLRDIKSSLTKQAFLIESQIHKSFLKEENIAGLDALIKSLSVKIKCRVTLINPNGRVLADSDKSPADVLKMENHLYRPEVKSALSGAIGEDIHYSSTLGTDMLYVALPVKDKDGISGAVRLSLPLDSVKNTLQVVRNIIILSFIFAIVLAVIFGSILASGIIKPIHKMIYVSRKFSRQEFNQRINLESHDELRELAETMNNMAQAIEDKIKEVEIQNQHLKAILQSMVEGIIVTDKSGGIVSVNPSIEKIFGIKKEEAEGKLFLEAIRNNELADIINKVLEDGVFISEELSLIYPVQRVFQINAAAILERGLISGCLAVIHDITEVRRLEAVRRDFVASASHELKTPLTSIKGFVETLIEGALEDKENSRQFLKIIQEHTIRLDNLVNDLLSLSYLESKDIRLDKQSVDLKGLTDKVISGFYSQLKKKNIAQVENNLPKEFILDVDENKIEQILTNLLDNAIKFNRDKGLIKVYSQEVDGFIKVVVEDSGTGIPQKHLPRIFERFYRVDNARSRELGGTGLGLSIVKHIVQLHGGDVGVESVEGIGSKFWFTLPKI